MSDIEFAMSTYAEAARKVPAEKRAEAGAWAVWLLARRCAYEDAARDVERGRKCPGCGTANHEALIAQGMLDAAEILRCEPFDRIWDAIAVIELRAEQIRDAADHSGVAGEPEATTKEAPEIDSEPSPTQVPVPDPVDPPAADLAGGTPIPGWPDEHMVEAAWGLIANVVNWDSPDLTPGWREAAERWRDAYHRQLTAGPRNSVLFDGTESAATQMAQVDREADRG